MKQINKEKWSEVFSQSKEKLAKTTKNVVDRLEDGVDGHPQERGRRSKGMEQ